jgi:hypothetical protein
MQLGVKLLTLRAKRLQAELFAGGTQLGRNRSHRAALTQIAVLFGACEVVESGQEGANGLGHRRLSLDPAVTLDSGSVVYEVGLQALQILKDLKLAVKLLGLAVSVARVLVSFLGATFRGGLPVWFNWRTLPRHLLSGVTLAARWVCGCLGLFIAVSH